jgi:hypothetical protein
MTKKIIKLTESDLQKIVKRVIQEQSMGTISIVNPGQNAEAEIVDRGGKKLLKVRTESGREQSVFVKTMLPIGKFMFEMGNDGKKMFGFDPKTKKKIEIFSTPFDEKSVDYLEELNVNFYKIVRTLQWNRDKLK